MPPTKKTAKKKSASKLTPAALIPDQLAPLVIRLRHENVILDSDIAELYGISVGQLNQAVKRNSERFPSDFMFQISDDDLENLKSQFVISSSDTKALRSQFATLKPDNRLRSQSVTLKNHGGRRTLPYAFSEQGVAMLSSVLRSPRAVEVNIAIMRTFVQLRSLMQSNKLLAEKIEKLEEKYDQNFQIVFDAIKQLITADENPSKELGFHTIKE
ncbi:MAG: ORF6N domain-containing protein [Verrucomicrobiota bacterium]